MNLKTHVTGGSYGVADDKQKESSCAQCEHGTVCFKLLTLQQNFPGGITAHFWCDSFLECDDEANAQHHQRVSV